MGGQWGTSFQTIGTMWPAAKNRSASADSAKNHSSSVNCGFGGWSTPEVNKSGPTGPHTAPPTPSGACVRAGIGSGWLDNGVRCNNNSPKCNNSSPKCHNSSPKNSWEPWAPQENFAAFMRPQQSNSTPQGTNPWAHLNHNSLKQAGPD